MIAMLGGMVAAARRSRGIQGEAEDVASRALPEIGEIAERKHQEKFGRAPTSVPTISGRGRASWYPETKKHPHSMSDMT